MFTKNVVVNLVLNLLNAKNNCLKYEDTYTVFSECNTYEIELINDDLLNFEVFYNNRKVAIFLTENCKTKLEAESLAKEIYVQILGVMKDIKEKRIY